MSQRRKPPVSSATTASWKQFIDTNGYTKLAVTDCVYNHIHWASSKAASGVGGVYVLKHIVTSSIQPHTTGPAAGGVDVCGVYLLQQIVTSSVLTHTLGRLRLLCSRQDAHH